MNSEQRRKIAKYGFGMAPISARMQGRYDLAVEAMLDYLAGDSEDIEPELLSELKGMFNRCIRKDQRDWFSVYSQFGEPSRSDCSRIVAQLADLRASVVSGDHQKGESTATSLRAGSLPTYLTNFRNRGPSHDRDGISGWIYVLSTREQPGYLKIGKTTRSVLARVKEINRATGVLFPFSPRAVFRVENAGVAEREVFALLQDYRLRSDREFFEMDFRDAVRRIEEHLSASEQTG